MLLMLDVAVRRAAATRRHAVRRCQIDESMQRWLPFWLPLSIAKRWSQLPKGQLPKSRSPLARPLDSQKTHRRYRWEVSLAVEG